MTTQPPSASDGRNEMVGMDTSSVAGVPCEQAGSQTGGLTPLEKELVEVLNDIAKYAFQTGNGVPSIGHAACLADIARRAKDAVAAVNERPAIAKAEATATEAQHAGQWVLVPREPTEAMIEAMRMAQMAPGVDDGYPIWDNMEAPPTRDRAAWEAVLPYLAGKTFHASYEWPEWQIALFQAAYRAMIAAAPVPPADAEGRQP